MRISASTRSTSTTSVATRPSGSRSSGATCCRSSPRDGDRVGDPERHGAPMKTRFGAQLWSQQASWPDWRDAALAAEEAGWDSICTWDHLLAIFGPWEQPVFEGW